MKIVLANIPFVEFKCGTRFTGPNSGCRFPWNEPGDTPYGPFPFLLGYATAFLREYGFDAELYDGVGAKDWDPQKVKDAITTLNPDILVLDIAKPTSEIVCKVAKWAKMRLSCKIVMVGPHCYTYGDDLLKSGYVDHVVIGEYELPLLDIANGTGEKKIINKMLDQIDTVDGHNFIPYRPYSHLNNYWDPSIGTPRVQLQVNTSRGCPFQCTYCMLPKVMFNGTYRARRADLVRDEIAKVIQTYGGNPGIGSIFFDDDTWNIGNARVSEMCDYLRRFNLPWSMMGRLDTSPLELFQKMVDCGCVGMRFGIESFQQRLLDNTKKNLKAATIRATVEWLLTHLRGVEFHFTSMINMPGERPEDWDADQRELFALQELAAKNGNRVHWQNSNCVAFPGTALWEQMSKRANLDPIELYETAPHATPKMALLTGWLGEGFKS